MCEEFKNDCSTESCTSDCSSCGCGCGSAPTQPQKVTLTLDDGSVVTCAVITTFTVEENNYIVLLPLDENGENEDGEVWFYRYSENPDDPNEEPELGFIDSDDEYEAVADAFDEYLDSVEFDEIVDEE